MKKDRFYITFLSQKYLIVYADSLTEAVLRAMADCYSRGESEIVETVRNLDTEREYKDVSITVTYN